MATKVVSEMTSFRSDSIETIPVKRRMSLLSLILFVTPIVNPLMSALFEHLLCLDKEDTERISRHFRHNASPSILLCSLRFLSLSSAIIVWTQVRTSDPKIHFIPSATSTNTNFRIQKTFYTLSTKMHLINPIIFSLLSTTALALPATNQSHARTALDKRGKEGWLGSFVSNDCSGPVSTNSISNLKEDQVSICIAQTFPSSKHLVAPSSWTVHPSDMSQAPVSTLDREKLT